MYKVLFTSIGRRVQLIRHFVESHWQVIGTDLDPEGCATQFWAQEVYPVPPSTHPHYVNTLMEICLKECVSHLVPLYEPELILLSLMQDQFLAIGTTVVVSNTEVLERCLDKYKLYQWLRAENIQTPDTYAKMPLGQDATTVWVVKPRKGMGSRDVHIVPYKDIEACISKASNPIIQRFIEGQEYSIDAYVAKDGQVLSVVPRLRLEVRSGEVSKSITVSDEQVTRLTLQLLERLRLFGPVTIQGIKETTTGIFYFIEVNPRFGGGVPLTMQAGIPYCDFIAGKYDIQKGMLHSYQSGLKMLRYDEAIFVTK